SRTVRIFPYRMKGEGHYLALLKKRGDEVTHTCDALRSASPRKNILPGELDDFLRDIKREFDPSRIDIRGDKVYYMPEGLPALNGVRFIRTGLLMGELKKKRFEPSQAL